MKAKDFQSRQKKAYLIFFSCAAVLIILLIMVCAFAFGRNAQSAEHSASSTASPTAGGFITFPPVSDTAETTQTAAPSNSDCGSSSERADISGAECSASIYGGCCAAFRGAFLCVSDRLFL